VPRLDEFVITLANIARAEHIRGAVGRGPGQASPPSAAADDGSVLQQPADVHSSGAATADTPASYPLSAPRPPGNASAETPVYATRLGRPPITPGTNDDECAMLQCQSTFCIASMQRVSYYGLRPADTALQRNCVKNQPMKVHYAQTKFTGLQRDGCQRIKLTQIVMGSKSKECKVVEDKSTCREQWQFQGRGEWLWSKKEAHGGGTGCT